MRINPEALKEGLKEILAMDGAPKDYIGARWIIRGALEYIRQLEGDLRRAGFTEYNDPKESENQ